MAARSGVRAGLAMGLLLLPAQASAAVHVLSAAMSGSAVVPPNASTATGTCQVSVDDVANTIALSGAFTGLGSPATVAALHGPAGAFTTAPTLLAATSLSKGVSGTFSTSATLLPARVAAVVAGQTYCEVDDALFPAGEIRGQVTAPAATPALAPVAIGALGAALAAAGVAFIVGQRRRNARGWS